MLVGHAFLMYRPRIDIPEKKVETIDVRPLFLALCNRGDGGSCTELVISHTHTHVTPHKESSWCSPTRSMSPQKLNADPAPRSLPNKGSSDRTVFELTEPYRGVS